MNWDCNVAFKIPLTAHDELAIIEVLRGFLIEFVCTIVALWFGLLASHIAKVVKSAVPDGFSVGISGWSRDYSTPAQLQCSRSGAWEPGNEATRRIGNLIRPRINFT